MADAAMLFFITETGVSAWKISLSPFSFPAFHSSVPENECKLPPREADSPCPVCLFSFSPATFLTSSIQKNDRKRYIFRRISAALQRRKNTVGCSASLVVIVPENSRTSEKLKQLSRLSWTDGFWLLYRQSLHVPGKLFPCNLSLFLLCPWPLVIPIRKTFVQKDKAIWFPKQCLDSVTASAAKQE